MCVSGFFLHFGPLILIFFVSLQRMLTKTQAIVLHSLKYGETRLIVDMFTRSQGRQSFIVSIPKTVKGKIKKQLFQPLTLLEIEADLRPKLQLQKLSDVRLASPFSSIPFEPHKLSISLFVAEFLYYALRSEQHNEPLFDYIVNSIQWLDLDHYQPGCYFDLRESIFLSVPPVHRDFLYPQEAEKIQLMMRMDFPTMHLFRMSHQDRNRLLEVSLSYYRLHIPDFPELKSVSVLQELYQ